MRAPCCNSALLFTKAGISHFEMISGIYTRDRTKIFNTSPLQKGGTTSGWPLISVKVKPFPKCCFALLTFAFFLKSRFLFVFPGACTCIPSMLSILRPNFKGPILPMRGEDAQGSQPFSGASSHAASSLFQYQDGSQIKRWASSCSWSNFPISLSISPKKKLVSPPL